MSEIAGIGKVRIGMIESTQANAFVLPGARILVTRKLVAYAGTEDELAGVLAHEFGHVLKRDGERDMFSLDGNWILAQDDANLYLFTRQPLVFVVRIDAPDAYPAQFSPDCGSVVFYDENYRVERWNLASKTREWVHEVVPNKGCFESTLSPDGA